MTFLAPWLLWGLLAALIPILIHLIHRRPRRTVPWAATDFLIPSDQSSESFRNLRQRLILLLRILALTALVLSAARPLLSHFFRHQDGKIDELVLIWDRSASMGMKPDHLTSLSARVPELIREIRKTLPDCEVTLLESESGRLIPLPDPMRPDEFHLSHTTEAAADIPGLVDKALTYSEEHPTKQISLWIASDMQRSSWNPESPLWNSIRQRLDSLPNPPDLRILEWRERPERNRGVRLRHLYATDSKLIAEIDVFSHDCKETPVSLPVRFQLLQLTDESEIAFQGSHFLFRQEMPLPDGISEVFGSVSIPHDDFPADDLFFFTFSVPKKDRILIIGGTDELRNTLSHMAAPPGIQGKQIITGVSLQDVPNLDDVSLVIRIGSLPLSEEALRLTAYLKQGGTLLFLPPENGRSNDASFFGGRWQNVEEARDGEYLTLTSWERTDGPLRNGSGDVPLPLDRVRAIRRMTWTGAGTSLAQWNDGACALGQIRVGQGEAYFLTSLPLDSYSNLAEGHLMLPLLHRLSRLKAERQEKPFAGEVGEAQRSSDQAELLLGADGSDPSSASPKTKAGVYRAGSSLFAVNRPESEDCPDQISAEELIRILPNVSQHDAETIRTPSDARELSLPLFCVAVLCLSAEAALSQAKRPSTFDH